MRKAETTNRSPLKSSWHLFANEFFKHHWWEAYFLGSSL